MADWETGYLIAELNSGRYFKNNAAKYAVKTVGLTHKPIMTMGGVRLTPEVSLDAFVIKNAEILILPGGDTWLEPIHTPVLEKVVESWYKLNSTREARYFHSLMESLD